MRIEVTGKQLDLTDAIRDHAEQKAEKLPRYFNGVQEIDFVLEQLKHEEFQAEIQVDVVKHDTFVARARGTDIYGCIDQAVEKMTRQLRDFKEKLKSSSR